MVQEPMCDRLIIPNVEIIDINISIRIGTLRTWTRLELLCEVYISCPRSRLSDIVVELGLEVVECVNVLRPSNLHRHYPGTAFVKYTISAVTHNGRQPSDWSTHLFWSGEEMSGWLWQRWKRWPQNAGGHPFLYGMVDLGPQPWVSCASRSWRKLGRSSPFASREGFHFWTLKIYFWTLWILTSFSIFIPRNSGLKDCAHTWFGASLQRLFKVALMEFEFLNNIHTRSYWDLIKDPLSPLIT
jgi:hypothetical protein